MLHGRHALDPDRCVLVLTQYLDDSGSDTHSPVAVIGGPVIDRDNFFLFEWEWDRLLKKHHIDSPIHMKEFARPHGRFAHLTDNERESLFDDLVQLINRAKKYSTSVRVNNLDFRQFFPAEKYKGLFGPSPLAYLFCLIVNSVFLRSKGETNPIAYLVAESDDNSQLADVHAAWRIVEDRYQESQKLSRTGAIAFDWPKNICALQASDLIAWSNRRHAINVPFNQGFAPLRYLTDSKEVQHKVMHFHFEVTAERAQSLAQSIDNGEAFRKIGRLEFAKWVADANQKWPDPVF